MTGVACRPELQCILRGCRHSFAILRSGPTWKASWRTLMDIYSTIPGVDAVSQTFANKRGKYVTLSDSELCSEHCICMLIIAD